MLCYVVLCCVVSRVVQCVELCDVLSVVCCMMCCVWPIFDKNQSHLVAGHIGIPFHSVVQTSAL